MEVVGILTVAGRGQVRSECLGVLILVSLGILSHCLPPLFTVVFDISVKDTDRSDMLKCKFYSI